MPIWETPTEKWFGWLLSLWIVALMISGILLGAWWAIDSTTEPTQEQIQRALEVIFDKGTSRWKNLELQPKGGNRYVGTAESTDAKLGDISVEVKDDGIYYTVKAEGSEGGGYQRFGFFERHPSATLWLYLDALLGSIFGVVFPFSGFVGLRKRGSLLFESIMYISGVANAGLSVLFGYQLFETLS